MADIFSGKHVKIYYNVDTGNRAVVTAGNIEISQLAQYPSFSMGNEVAKIETYNDEYANAITGQQTVDEIEIVVNYVPTDTTHQFLDAAYDNGQEFQITIFYNEDLEAGRLESVMVNGVLASRTISGGKDAVVTMSYSFAPTELVSYAPRAIPVTLHRGDYGVGSDGTVDYPQYEPDKATGNAFVKISAGSSDNPTSVDMMGIELVDGKPENTNIMMTTTGDLRMYARNASTAWTRLYTSNEADTRYLIKTNNLSDLSDFVLARSNLDLYSKTEADDKFMEGKDNLSEITDTEEARTNLDVYSKSETDSLADSVQTNLDTYITSNNETIDSINTIIIVNKNQVDGLSDTVDGISSDISDLVDVVNANKTQVDNYITINNEVIENINSTLDQLSDSVDTRFVNVVLKTTTVNGKPLTGNITLIKSDVGLGNVTNDAQLKIASNLSDLGNIATARSNLQLERYRQGTTETSILSANSKYAFRLFDNGLWGNYDLENGVYIPLSIDRGGTGATSLTNARINLQIDRLIPSGDGSTFIGNTETGFKRLGFYQSSGNWGLLNDAGNGWVPLGIPQGGTGAGNSTDASINLSYYGKFGSHFNLTNGNMDTLTGPGDNSGGETYSVAIPTDSNSVTGWPLNPNNSKAYGWGSLLCFNHGTSAGRTQIYIPDDGANLYFRQRYSTVWKNWVRVWTNRNTTVDSNGFIKNASPIVKLYSDGSSVLNDESEGVTSERIDTGTYHVYGTKGLNTDGWTIEIPQDINGNRLCFVSTDYDEEDDILVINTYTRKFDYETAMIVAGEAIDIPTDRWIDLRVEMPVDSIWNQKTKDNEQGYQDNE
ncbi:pyocin knob domain-containing protein [Citrobacter sp. CK194]|uniref:pyocin knob domain-containing protein n=1 Tax=Citrobacter sp. CK194 TaxID=2985103 RepID=UPI0025789A9B|nr:pyocin knob domain-containing protein [Citrobacter sp. CK194]MDM3025341.1 pyocin knob domain-containing protein [Citrobacter sp. CK194]